MTQPIGRAVVVAERIAKGDLTSEIEVRIHDETGRLLEAIRAMQDRLRTLVGGIRQAADSIQAASSLQQTAQSMDHLTSIVTHGADSAKQANQLALNAAVEAAREIKGLIGASVERWSAAPGW